MSRNASRLKEFELRQSRDRRKRELEWQYDEGGYGYEAPRRISRNTLGPQEDVIEHRRNLKRVATTAPPGGTSHNILMENFILLLLLAGSIYGMYRLCLYILNS